MTMIPLFHLALIAHLALMHTFFLEPSRKDLLSMGEAMQM
jgi:hypothetical protein